MARKERDCEELWQGKRGIVKSGGKEGEGLWSMLARKGRDFKEWWQGVEGVVKSGGKEWKGL